MWKLICNSLGFCSLLAILRLALLNVDLMEFELALPKTWMLFLGNALSMSKSFDVGLFHSLGRQFFSGSLSVMRRLWKSMSVHLSLFAYRKS